MYLQIELPEALSGGEFQLLTDEAFVDARLPHSGAESKAMARRPQHLIKRVNGWVAARPLQLCDGGLAHPEASSQLGLAETRFVAGFADEGGGQ